MIIKMWADGYSVSQNNDEIASPIIIYYIRNNIIFEKILTNCYAYVELNIAYRKYPIISFQYLSQLSELTPS